MKLNRFLLLVTALVIAAVSALAQSYVGEVRGIVQDPGGAVIANANVTLRNDATGTVRTTVSNSAGEYVFPQVDPATYTVTVQTPGFKKLENPDVIVGTQQKVRLDLKLELGEISQSVSVTTEAPLIENETASNGQVINTQQLKICPTSAATRT